MVACTIYYNFENTSDYLKIKKDLLAIAEKNKFPISHHQETIHDLKYFT